MRIVDQRRDYYDCIQAQGQDLSLVYIRSQKEVDISKQGFPFPSLLSNADLGGGNTPRDYIIGFCGKIYPVIKVWYYLRPVQERVKDPWVEQDHSFCYKIEDLDIVVNKHFEQKWIDAYFAGRRDRNIPWNSGGARRQNFTIFFDDALKMQDAFQSWFDAEKSPIFVAEHKWDKSTITYNPLLRQYNFMRVFDPPRAFQEIRMYMSNMAMPGRPIPQLSNEDKIHAAGFDIKYSFRKDKSDRSHHRKNK